MLYETWHVIYFNHSCNALCVHIQMYEYMPNHLVHHVPTTTASSSPEFCIPSTQHVPFLYPVPLQLLCCHPIYASTSACILIARYLVCTLCLFFLSTIYRRLTLTYGHDCNIAKALTHITDPLLGPT